MTINNVDDDHERVRVAMRQITDAWVSGRVDDLAANVHTDVVMVFPGFAGRLQGREAFLAGFRDFCQNAKLHQFRQGEQQQVDVVGQTAVVSFDYEMVYERGGERYRVTGRDLWVFGKRNGAWMAVWRTMLDLNETAA